MLLKIIGSVMVISASSLIGYLMSKDCSKRPDELRTLQGLLQMFETEISYLSNVLSDSFGKISRTSDSSVAAFFRATVQKLSENSGLSACQAWEIAVRENIRTTSLNKEDERILLSFGKMLGNSDIEGQIKNIRLALAQLKLQEQKAEEDKKKNESMYRSLGILGGIALVIMFV